MSLKRSSRNSGIPVIFAISSSAAPPICPRVTAASPTAERLGRICSGRLPDPERANVVLMAPSSSPAAGVQAARNAPARTLSARPWIVKVGCARASVPKRALPLTAPP